MADDNPGVLESDFFGEISGNNIIVRLFEGTIVSALIAVFEYEGKQIYIDDVLQISGSTENNFTEPVIYRVEAEDGSSVGYEIIIEFIEDTDFTLKSFTFRVQNNPILREDVELDVSEGSEYTAEFHAPLRHLIPDFDVGDALLLLSDEIQASGESRIDFTEPVTFTLISTYGAIKTFTVNLNIKNDFPHIYIYTENNQPVDQKNTYINAEIEIDGAGFYDDFSATTGIRGRGNTSWNREKKPYKLKLESKGSIFGLGKEKKWVLLANDFDETLMLNSVAMQIGHLIDFPYTNHMIPTDLTLNGEFLGSYVLTEQVEVKSSRINMNDEGLLLELDVYYDEDWQFRTEEYNLPTMIKFPKLEDLLNEEAEAKLQEIKDEFNELTSTVYDNDFPNNGYGELFDKEAYAEYLVIYMLSANMELNQPKSTYLYRPEGGKFKMGPLWDFDWAFSFDGISEHFIIADKPFFETGNNLGTVFFGRLLFDDHETIQLLKDKWNYFSANKMNDLLAYVDDYADLIKFSQQRNYTVWQRGSIDFMADVQKLKNWLVNRAEYLDSYINSL